MNQFLKKAFVLFVLFSSISVFAQDDIFGEKKAKPFNPKLTLGTGFYTLTGDIQSNNTGILKGNSGYNVGMKFELSHNLDFSFLFIKTAFSATNDSEENFKSDIDGFGLNLGYTANQLFKQSKISPTFSLGIQKLGVNTDAYDRSSVIAIPLGFGLRMNITDRCEFDVTMNFGMGLGDVDMSTVTPEHADSYKSLQLAIHYDLFTPNPQENTYFDDSYYADVDFAKLESEDEDGDLVLDIDDYCPKTPIGVKVDLNGCPLDDDKDGIANYLDQQKTTPEGSIVDENGVRLTVAQYHSMYSDFEAASREYANFYNESEIKRENYKTVDEYLIAKANAFNKAYNEGKDLDNTVAGLKYKVKIGEFSDGVPANVINKYLSLDDLESIPQDNGLVIYAVGTYNTLDDALSRLYELEAKRFNETSILVDNNGEVSDYIPPAPEPVIDEEEEVVAPTSEEIEEDQLEKEEKKVVESSNETIFRIQIGAFKEAIPDAVFVGVGNIISFTGKDGLMRYVTGSFTEYKDAIDYQMQMKARGFEDAFIVTYKNGERISLNVAIQTEKETAQPEVVVEEEAVKLNIEFTVQVLVVKPNIEFTVQVLVAEESLSAENLTKMSKLGNIEKEAEGQELYCYFIGTYSSFENANIRLAEAKLAGYTDAFVFAKLDGERITLEQAMYPDFLGTYSLLEDANIRLAEVKLAGHPDAFVFATLDGERITLKQAKELMK